jgi:hypothetical protein
MLTSHPAGAALQRASCSRITSDHFIVPFTGRRPMNYKRILLAGVIAGLIINLSEFLLNGVVLAGQMEADLTRHNLVSAPWAMTAYVIMGFVSGFFLAWCYAAIRPRFGAGFGTALVAATALWTVGYVLPTVGILAVGLGRPTSYLLALVWAAVEVVIAAGAAGYLYREAEAPAVQTAIAQ